MSRFSLLTPAGRLRLLSWVEGISFVLLLVVTMPLKYIWHIPEPNHTMGMLHGVLFVAYMITLLLAVEANSWGWRVFVLGFVASIVPFGTFWAERKLFVEK